MGNATIAIDGHVHLYEVYDLMKAVESGVRNLSDYSKKINSKVIPIWLLVERSDANFFDQISQSPENYENGGLKYKKGKDDLTIVIEQNGQPILYIFAGRQLVTKEGLEVLSLISNLNIPDRQKSIDEVIQEVKDSGDSSGNRFWRNSHAQLGAREMVFQSWKNNCPTNSGKIDQ